MRSPPPDYRTLFPKTVITDGPDCYPWTKCYAWLPVRTIAGRIVWREHLYKRRVWVSYGMATEPETQYATMIDLLTVDQ